MNDISVGIVVTILLRVCVSTTVPHVCLIMRLTTKLTDADRWVQPAIAFLCNNSLAIM